MPKPNAGESKKDYLPRCMGDASYVAKYPDEKQRYAVCNSVYDQEHGSANEKAYAVKLLDVFAWKEEDHPRHPKGKGDGGKFAPGDPAADEAKNPHEGVSHDDWLLVGQTNNEAQSGARGAIKDLKAGGMAEEADRLTEAAKDWRNVVKAMNRSPGGKGFDPTDAKVALDSWQEEYGYNTLMDMTKESLKQLDSKGKHSNARIEVISSFDGGGPRESFNVKFAMSSADAKKGEFSGVASMFGSMVDTWPPTRMQKGAFAKTLADPEKLRRVKLLYQHNTDWPIGKPTELKEVPEGLFIRAPISKTSIGEDVMTLLNDGVLDEMSVGFDPVSWRMVKEEGMRDQVRYLDEAQLWEVSIVTFAADRAARIMSLHSVTPFQDLPLADIGQAWDSGAAIGRIKDWATSGDNIDYSKYRRAFLWADDPKDQQGSYKFPIADVDGGALKAIPRAIFAAAARLSSANISDADKKGIQAHLTRYYKKLDRTPPWTEGADLRLTSEWLASLPATAGFNRQAKALTRIVHEIRAGIKQPLSAKGRLAVAETIAEFQGLLQAAEPPPNGAATERQRQDAAIGQRLRELNLAAIEAGIL